MTARPAPGTVLCPLAAIPDPGAKGFRFREGEAQFLGFVVRKDGRVAGYVDHCPHAGWPLALVGDRYLTREQDLIICSAHGALFRPDDGRCVAGPCAGEGLEPWPVEVRGDAVVVA